MALRWSVRPNAYVDSVRLMRVSDELSKLPGVVRAAAVMATPLNVELLAADGILPPDSDATPNDLLIAVMGEDELAAEMALGRLDELLAVRTTEQEQRRQPPRRLETAAGADLAVIAVPGAHAATEAFAALRAGMDVFLFSDNVALEDEVHLKDLATRLDRLMMGPDCGTAILDGIGLGFANRVRPGPVGIVGASGTGIQQVCCLLDRAGIGIAQAIGTGGRDLSGPVGGSMTRRALHVLESDPAVAILMVISKPPDPDAAQRLQEDLQSLSKPVVACLLGESPAEPGSVRYANTLTDAANMVIVQLGGQSPPAPAAPPALHPGQRVYGFYTGGTLASETDQILNQAQVPSRIVDLGADQYTRGRPHPIIDPRLRSTMLEDLAHRSDAGVVMLDIILGDLAHPDPAAPLLPALQALKDGSNPAVLAVLVGTDADPQGLARQRDMLEAAGATVYASNAEAARAASALVSPAGREVRG